MKYLAIPLAILILACCFTGCTSPKDASAPSFYYLCSEPSYGSEGTIIGSEQRLSGDTNSSLRYLLALYLNGPIDSSLRSPFPAGTAIITLERNGDSLEVVLNSAFAKLSGAELTKACACIALTVFSSTGIQTVAIRAEDTETGVTRTMELTRDSLALRDTLSPPQ